MIDADNAALILHGFSGVTGFNLLLRSACALQGDCAADPVNGFLLALNSLFLLVLLFGAASLVLSTDPSTPPAHAPSAGASAGLAPPAHSQPASGATASSSAQPAARDLEYGASSGGSNVVREGASASAGAGGADAGHTYSANPTPVPSSHAEICGGMFPTFDDRLAMAAAFVVTLGMCCLFLGSLGPYKSHESNVAVCVVSSFMIVGNLFLGAISIKHKQAAKS